MVLFRDSFPFFTTKQAKKVRDGCARYYVTHLQIKIMCTLIAYYITLSVVSSLDVVLCNGVRSRSRTHTLTTTIIYRSKREYIKEKENHVPLRTRSRAMRPPNPISLHSRLITFV